MISKEEMYEFASLIAGITDSDLEAYKCGGKTKTKKMAGGDNIFKRAKNAVTDALTPVKTLIDKEILRRKKLAPKDNGIIYVTEEEVKREEEAVKAQQRAETERKNRETIRRNREFKRNLELEKRYPGRDERNENVKLDWMKKGKK